jgi:hypothetical protein
LAKKDWLTLVRLMPSVTIMLRLQTVHVVRDQSEAQREAPCVNVLLWHGAEDAFVPHDYHCVVTAGIAFARCQRCAILADARTPAFTQNTLRIQSKWRIPTCTLSSRGRWAAAQSLSQFNVRSISVIEIRF